MTSPPIRLYRVAQLREIDRRAIAALGGDSHALMMRASAAAHRRLAANWPRARRLVVVCGTGNNGGDGYGVAMLAKAAGRDVVVIASAPPSTRDAQRARDDALAAGVEVRAFDGAVPDADLVVDALLGIGLTAAPRADVAALIDAINAQRAPVLALDVPSGLDADTGAAPGACVQATATVTFLAMKRGLATGVAPARRGACWLETLDVPASVFDDPGEAVTRIDDAMLRRALLPRARDAHKGRHGHVLVIGGDDGYGGAVRLAAEAALRSGAGLVSVATRATNVAALQAGIPEAMTRAVATRDAAAAMIARASVVAIGPGLGTGDWSRALFDAALAGGKPLVLDADALNLLATAGVDRLPAHAVMTPHPGEAARLAGVTVADIERDRFAAATMLAKRFDAITLLKGAGTIIATPDGALALSDSGNPGMATGGMGDVLTGVIAALVAQHVAPADAARIGAYLHGAAGDRAARAIAERGFLARDLIAQLPRVLPQ